MLTRLELADYVYDALKSQGGKASILQISKHVWKNHRTEIENSGDMFFTWQYDMRWAGQHLRDSGKLMPADKNPRGVWEIAA